MVHEQRRKRVMERIANFIRELLEFVEIPALRLSAALLKLLAGLTVTRPQASCTKAFQGDR
jgi:hypothetical protein